MTPSKAERVKKLKEEGNSSFSQKQYKAAIAEYTEAIYLDHKTRFLYGNRSGCRLSLRQYLGAASDAFLATGIDSTYVKG
ncbi:chaperone activator sti1 [Moniliophthora roreri MCA 2997]|nr:chaperone activator sti1 [Moniliophthora roreri MCA 2997]KAI3606074.1 chaperone activator sti1 [Moniliophthora roreri]